MAHGKAHVQFLLSVTELLFVSYGWGATRQNVSKLAAFRRGRSLGATISGGRGRPWGIFLVSTKLDTFCYLAVQTAPCYVPSFWHTKGVWQTDGQTDGIAAASTALAMRVLWRAVKTIQFSWTTVNMRGVSPKRLATVSKLNTAVWNVSIQPPYIISRSFHGVSTDICSLFCNQLRPITTPPTAALSPFTAIRYYLWQA